MLNELTFDDDIFKKDDTSLKYDIKNKSTQTYIYMNPNVVVNFDVNLKNLNFIIVSDESKYNEISDYLIRLVKNKLLCANLLYSKIVDALNNCTMLVIIGENLPYGTIYSFSAISYISESINTIYGIEKDTYLYADYICSHKNIKYAGDKLMNSLFQISNALDINKFQLEPVESAVSFYEKYGFIHSGDNYTIRNGNKMLKNLMVKYIKENPIEMNVDTQIYVSEDALNYIKEEDDDVELNNFNIPLNPIPNELINELVSFLQKDVKDEIENPDEWLKENTEYNIILVVKNKTNNEILGFAFVQPIVFYNKLSLLIYSIFSNVNVKESSKIILNEIEKYGISINVHYIKSYFNSENINFYNENGYKPVSSLKTNLFVFKPIRLNGGKRMNRSKRIKINKKLTKRKNKHKKRYSRKR